MPVPSTETIVVGAVNSVEGKVLPVPDHQTINEKLGLGVDDKETGKDGEPDDEIHAAPPVYDGDNHDKDDISEDVIIVTGADASAHLLPLRDDGDPALTFRSLFLATVLSAFQAVMSQIYQVHYHADSSDVDAQQKLTSGLV
jgi:phenylalanyl-tRNA synthetase beta subunit